MTYKGTYTEILHSEKVLKRGIQIEIQLPCPLQHIPYIRFPPIPSYPSALVDWYMVDSQMK